MDHRSLKFLKDYNINHGLHTPKKINRSMLNYFDKFLAVDPFVLNHLNAKYPKYKQKFRSMTMQFSDIDIVDPYKLKPYEYIKVMQDIKYISEKINLELY